MNVVGTITCTAPVSELSINVGLYLNNVLVAQGSNTNFGSSFIQGNAARACVNGSYRGGATRLVIFPPGCDRDGMNAADRLARRIADLDHGPGDPAREDVKAGLTHFIRVLQQAVPPGQPPDPAAVDTLTAAEADRLQRRSRLLDHLAAHVPQLTDGPLDRQAQYWIATGRPHHLPARQNTPQESSFIPVTKAAGSLTGAKPFGAGLFTSTGLPGGYGMWRCYLSGYESSSSLYLRPWHIWQLQPRPTSRIYEIRDAARWVQLLTAYPRAERGFLHPDWPAIAARWDAVHITLRAITAAQGFSFTTPHGPTVAPYWDVESTFWLSWCFTPATLRERDNGHDPG